MNSIAPVYLEAEFRNLVQGDMDITQYTGRLKHLADALRDVGQPVRETSQVLNMLRSLSSKYRHAIPAITAKQPPIRSSRRVLICSLRNTMTRSRQRLLHIRLLLPPAVVHLLLRRFRPRAVPSLPPPSLLRVLRRRATVRPRATTTKRVVGVAVVVAVSSIPVVPVRPRRAPPQPGRRASIHGLGWSKPG
jgi:hypothetical protein